VVGGGCVFPPSVPFGGARSPNVYHYVFGDSTLPQCFSLSAFAAFPLSSLNPTTKNPTGGSPFRACFPPPRYPPFEPVFFQVEPQRSISQPRDLAIPESLPRRFFPGSHPLGDSSLCLSPCLNLLKHPAPFTTPSLTTLGTSLFDFLPIRTILRSFLHFCSTRVGPFNCLPSQDLLLSTMLVFHNRLFFRGPHCASLSFFPYFVVDLLPLDSVPTFCGWSPSSIQYSIALTASSV